MSVVACTADSHQLGLVWPDGALGRFHPLWLRDNCPSAGDRANAFRTFSVVDLDPDLTIASAEVADDAVVVMFSDGHRSQFELAWLHDRAAHPAQNPDQAPAIDLWRDGEAIPVFEARDVEPGTACHLRLLEAVAARGASIVAGTDTSEFGTIGLAGLFGHIRDTDFGTLFDIVLEPGAWTKSQTGNALDPHTDDPYRYTPSGASILHCVESSNLGGDSILVDGFAVAEELRRSHPAAFELLSTTPVPFVRHRVDIADQGEDVHLLASAPIIAVDGHGEICGVRFHERSMAPLDTSPDLMGDYYRAFIRFTTMVNSADFSTQRRLGPGEALMFDNQRVLHGRTAFEGDNGRRHLRLCTVDRDQFHSRLRRLREHHGQPGVRGWLPAGNLS